MVGRGSMNNGYRTRIHPRDTGIWSQSKLSLHCVNLSHCTTIQFYIEFPLVPPHKLGGAMSNGNRARMYPRDTGIWSSPSFSVHCIVSLHCSASQISSECCLEVTAQGGY